jgi:uncharacterized membrane protein
MKLAMRNETATPMLALVFGTAACVALVLARIAWTGNLLYGFLVWNLFLAWLPLGFALLACDEYRGRFARNWRFIGFAGAWLLFFPNAPYICTDLIHLTSGFRAHFWVDLSLFLLSALTGLVLGFVSLYLMHAVVARILGRAASWGFIAVVALMSGFGMYVGRFLRFNSWDVLTQPLAVCKGISGWVFTPRPGSYALPVLFGAFLFTSYLMLYALTHLRPGESQPAAAS